MNGQEFYFGHVVVGGCVQGVQEFYSGHGGVGGYVQAVQEELGILIYCDLLKITMDFSCKVN